MWIGMTLKHARRLILATLTGTALLTGCAPAPVPQPIAPYQSRNLGTYINGRIVLATVQVRATVNTMNVDKVGICVDGFDFPAGDAVLTTAWLTVSSTRKFPPGDYVAWACVTDEGRAQEVTGPTTSFTVH